jgi:hypothetical protein
MFEATVQERPRLNRVLAERPLSATSRRWRGAERTTEAGPLQSFDTLEESRPPAAV